MAEILPLVALGTVADVVPLKDENRTIVKIGIDLLRNYQPGMFLPAMIQKNINSRDDLFDRANCMIPGLKALLNIVRPADRKVLSAKTIGWTLGPIINAAGKFKKGHLVFELFTTDDEYWAGKIIKELKGINQQRKNLGKENLERVISIIEEEYNITDDIIDENIIIIITEKVAHGVTGSVASKLIERFYRPVIILIIDDGEIAGLARSINEFDILSALSECSDLFLKFGGHRFAAGLSLIPDKAAEFKKRISAIADKKLSGKNLLPVIDIDLDLSLDDIDDNFVSLYRSLEPFGNTNPAPVFMSKTVTLLGFRPIGKDGQHLSLKLKGKVRSFQALFWFSGDTKEKLHNGIFLDIVYSIEYDSYNKKMKLILSDLKLSHISNS